MLGVPTRSSIEDLHALSLTTLHVLLVHADDSTAQAIRETVTRQDHSCDLVSDSGKVLELVRQKHYDLIIVEAHPPGALDGLALVAQIRTVGGEVRRRRRLPRRTHACKACAHRAPRRDGCAVGALHMRRRCRRG